MHHTSLSEAPPEGEVLSLLCVGRDAAAAGQLRSVLAEYFSRAQVHHVASVVEAEAALAKDPFHLVLAEQELPDGTGLDVLDYVKVKRLGAPVVVLAESATEAQAVRALKAGASDYIFKGDDDQYTRALAFSLLETLRRHRLDQQSQAQSRQREQKVLLNKIRATLARINHEVNNPLAIISGNAQLLLELARGMELEDDLTQPIRDIEEASRRIASLLRKLTSLKESLPQPFEEDEHGVPHLDSLQPR